MNDNNENFKLLSNLEKTITYINKELLNYPKYEVILEFIFYVRKFVKKLV